jgi:hypothetical protein
VLRFWSIVRRKTPILNEVTAVLAGLARARKNFQGGPAQIYQSRAYYTLGRKANCEIPRTPPEDEGENMSHSFYVPSGAWPPTSDFPACLDSPGVRCVEETPERPKGIYHVYQEGVSTRSIELDWSGDNLRVRIMSCSSPAEYELALRIVEYAGRRGTGKVASEDAAGEFPLDTLRVKYDARWVDHQVTGCIKCVAAIVEEQRKTVQLLGPNRWAYVGPKMIRELRQHPPEEFTTRIVDLLRRVQYCNLRGQTHYYEANTLAFRGPDGKEFTCATWGSETPYLFPKVEKFALQGDPFSAPPVLVSADALPHLAGDRLSWLDECQSLVEPVPQDEWGALLARARDYLTAAEPCWWQVWKRGGFVRHGR